MRPQRFFAFDCDLFLAGGLIMRRGLIIVAFLFVLILGGAAMDRGKGDDKGLDKGDRGKGYDKGGYETGYDRGHEDGRVAALQEALRAIKESFEEGLLDEEEFKANKKEVMAAFAKSASGGA